MFDRLFTSTRQRRTFFRQELESAHMRVSIFRNCVTTNIEEKHGGWRFTITPKQTDGRSFPDEYQNEIFAYSQSENCLVLSPCSWVLRVALSWDCICTISDNATSQVFLSIPVACSHEIENLIWFALNTDQIGRTATDKADMPVSMIFESIYMPIWDDHSFGLFDLVAETPFGKMKMLRDGISQSFQLMLTDDQVAALQADFDWRQISQVVARELDDCEKMGCSRDIALLADGRVSPIDLLSEIALEAKTGFPPFLVFRVHCNFCFMHAMDLLRTSEVLAKVRQAMIRTVGLFDFLSQERVNAHCFPAVQLYSSILQRSQAVSP